MYVVKKGFCLVMMFLLFSAWGTAEEKDDRFFNSSKVDEIYESIRYATPLYQWEERVVTFENEGMTMVSSLILPKTNKKCPLVIILNGFAGDRKEDLIPGTSEYLWARLSRILAEQGLASLRIDFRGSGESEGEYEMTTFSTQISDTMAAFAYSRLNLRHLVEWKSIGLLGFSQGGLVAACAAARDNRVESVLLWSPVTHAPIVYEGLLSKQGIRQGLALPEAGSVTLPIYINDEYINLDVPLGKGFFLDLYRIDPMAEVQKNYTGPLMVICGQQDPVVWPQPQMSELFLSHHEGFEKLVMLDADHAFNWWDGPEPQRFHDAIYWSAAWFLYTLR
jgi:pimeloyl-ACP methyl ester carboxylesterase